MLFGKDLVGRLLRYPYEIVFDDIQNVKITKEMLDLANHIVETKSDDFKPAKFEDRCENAFVELLNEKRKGEPVRTAIKSRDTGNVINLMDALRKSLTSEGKAAPTLAAAKTSSKKAPFGQREMTMAIPARAKAGRPPPKNRRNRAAPSCCWMWKARYSLTSADAARSG
jgi:DNA end-binding protein Ku